MKYFKGLKVDRMKSLIYPFLSENGKLLVTSVSNILKTQFTLQLCIDLLNKEQYRFLEEFHINSDLRSQNILFVNDNFTALSLSDRINRFLLGLHDDVKENILSHLFILNTKDQNATEVFKLIDESVKENNIDLVVIDGLKNTSSKTIDMNVDILAVEYKIPFIITKLVENDANYVNWMYRQKEFDKYATNVLFIENCKNYLKLHHLRTCSDSLFSKLNVSFDGEKMYPVEVGNKMSGNEILVKVMNSHDNVFERKGELVAAVRDRLKRLLKYSSREYATKLVDAGIESGLIKIVKGKYNNKKVVLCTE